MDKEELERSFSCILDTFFRKKKSWLDEETTLFFSVLSEIENRDEDNRVSINKEELLSILGLENNTDKLSHLLRLLMQNSNYCLSNDATFEWKEFFLITNVKVTNSSVQIQFDKEYVLLIERLNNYFSNIFINKVKHFKSRYAVAMYKDLMEHYTKSDLILSKKYTIKELRKLFDLADDAYVRKPELRLDVTSFKSRTLDYVIKEVNADPLKSGMYIEAITTIKERNEVAFVVTFRFIHSDSVI